MKLTLEQLVQDTVNTFLSSGQSFSVYDITTNIRNLVNAGAVVPTDVPVDGAGDFYDIQHSIVKRIFVDLFEDNGFAKPLTRTFVGSYFTYTADSNFQTAVKGATSAVARLASALGTQRNASSLVVPAQRTKFKAQTLPTTPVGALDATIVVGRVRQYLDGCKKRSFTPTPRQIQSAIKRGGKSTGWSRTDLNGIRNSIQAGIL